MKRNILIHPDPRLKKVCAPVDDLSDELRALEARLVTEPDTNFRFHSGPPPAREAA